jgi:hypothetical protein
MTCTPSIHPLFTPFIFYAHLFSLFISLCIESSHLTAFHRSSLHTLTHCGTAPRCSCLYSTPLFIECSSLLLLLLTQFQPSARTLPTSIRIYTNTGASPCPICPERPKGTGIGVDACFGEWKAVRPGDSLPGREISPIGHLVRDDEKVVHLTHATH